MKAMILVGSLLIGAGVATFQAYNAGFTSGAIGTSVINGLFAAAIVGWVGMKFLYKEK